MPAAADITRVGVVGCGLMGSGIAEVCARAGLDVVVRRGRRTRAAEPGRRPGRAPRSTGPCAAGKLTEDEPGRRARAGSRSPPTLDGAGRPRSSSSRRCVEDEAAQGRRLPQARQGGRRPGRHPRLEHLVDPDHEAGHGHAAARAGHRHPLLQPGAGAARWSSWCRRCSPRARPRPRADAVRRASVLGKHVIRSQDRAGFVVNALLDPLPAVGHPDARVGLRHGRGHRHRHGRGLHPPDGPAARSPTSSASTRRWRWPSRCTRSSRSRSTPRRRCSPAWSRPACSAASGPRLLPVHVRRRATRR